MSNAIQSKKHNLITNVNALIRIAHNSVSHIICMDQRNCDTILEYIFDWSTINLSSVNYK